MLGGFNLIFLGRIDTRDIYLFTVFDSFLILLAPGVIVDSSISVVVIVPAISTSGLFRSATARTYTSRPASAYININTNVGDLSGETSDLARDRLKHRESILPSCSAQCGV